MSDWKTAQTRLTVEGTIALFRNLLDSKGIAVFGVYDSTTRSSSCSGHPKSVPR
jgi:hypothetical protein